jgi:signal peptidase I
VLACAAGLGIFLFAIIDAYSSVKAYNNNAGAASGGGIAEKAAVAALVLLANPLTQAALVVGSFTGSLESMEPAVYAGDRVFVDLCTFRFLGIHRGDMIVYRIPGRPGKLFMHRVVGLPGESVELADQAVRIDGAPLAQPWALSKRYYNRGDFGRKGQSVLVPPKSYYVLGDYSTRSDDSRYTGFISERNVVGRIFKRWYPLSRSGSVE